MELRLDSVMNDIPYWCVFRAQTGISSAAMLTLFIPFHRGNRVCAAHGVHVPTYLDAEVLRGSASTHAHPNLLSTSLRLTCRFVTIEIQDSFTHSISARAQMRTPVLTEYIFPRGSAQEQEPFDPACFIFASPMSTPPYTLNCNFTVVSPFDDPTNSSISMPPPPPPLLSPPLVVCWGKHSQRFGSE